MKDKLNQQIRSGFYIDVYGAYYHVKQENPEPITGRKLISVRTSQDPNYYPLNDATSCELIRINDPVKLLDFINKITLEQMLEARRDSTRCAQSLAKGKEPKILTNFQVIRETREKEELRKTYTEISHLADHLFRLYSHR
jgi:hypothetical protein